MIASFHPKTAKFFLPLFSTFVTSCHILAYEIRNCQIFIACYVYNKGVIEIKFAERVKELRLDKEWRQKDLAQFVHVSTPTVTRWEGGVQEPDYRTLALLAQLFSVSTDYLLGLCD